MNSKFKIPYVDFKPKNDEIKNELLLAFENVLESGRYIQGEELANFETEFSNLIGTNFASGIANGTCSLRLSLESLNLPQNSEVITVPNSFIATAAAISRAGLKPVFVDVGDDMNIDVDKVENAINANTRAIIPVHLTGRPARMDKLLEISNKFNLFIIEDAAQAVGAKFKSKMVGSFGHIGSFSLHPLKNLHAYGDAGIVTTNNQNLYKRISLSKNHGLTNRTNCDSFSNNCRLDELQAAFLRVQLKKLGKWTEMRVSLAEIYNHELQNILTVPKKNSDEYHVYQTYMIRTSKRDELREYLRVNGVETIVHYPVPIHLQPAAKSLGYKLGSFPVAEKLSKEILSLPLYPGLTRESQNYVVSKIKEFFK